MHKLNVTWGSTLLAFTVGAAIFIAAAQQPAITYAIALLPFVFGANSLQVGLKGFKDAKDEATSDAARSD